MTKIGIIRCELQAPNCAGFNDFPAIKNKMGEFSKYDEIELVGFDTCGGCERGKPEKIVSRAQRLKTKGAQVIHLGTCAVGGRCPFEEAFAQAIHEKVGVPVIHGTHPTK